MSQEIRFCVAQDGVRLAYAKMGHGLPLVRVGTWLTHLEHDYNSPMWRPWLDNLARFHALYRYDPRGCGLSDWDVDAMTFDALLSDLEAVVDAAGLDQFALFGMSQGGCLALSYAARHPERVSHLLIYGGYMRSGTHRNPNAVDVEKTSIYPSLIRLAWNSDNPAYKMILSTELRPAGSMEQLGWLNDLQAVSTNAENAVKLTQAYGQINVTALAAVVCCPTLILHAIQDVAVSFEEGRLFATHIPNARFVPLDSKNHVLLPDDVAWDQFWREFYQFLGVSEAELPSVSYSDNAPLVHGWNTQLTLREREILHLLAMGQRNDEIAQTLVLTSKTVRNYISHIYEKLNVTSRGEAIVLAREAGFDQHQ